VLIGCRVVITVIVLVTGIIIRIIVVSGDRIVIIGFRHIVTVIVIIVIMVNVGSYTRLSVQQLANKLQRVSVVSQPRRASL
jgi:hypothetical protein